MTARVAVIAQRHLPLNRRRLAIISPPGESLFPPRARNSGFPRPACPSARLPGGGCPAAAARRRGPVLICRGIRPSAAD